MRNFSVKFALLAAHLREDGQLSPQDFLELAPDAMVERYKSLLSADDFGIVTFAFSNQAILDILDAEFEVEMERGALMFRKTYLDARSIRLAGAGRASSDNNDFTPAEQKLIDALAVWLLDATRGLYRGDLSEARRMDILEEYAENFRVYARKCVTDYEPGSVEPFLRHLFASLKSMMAFCHSLTVDALFKADAARVMFGEQSGYYQAWFRKQIFRHMMSKAVAEYINACLID